MAVVEDERVSQGFRLDVERSLLSDKGEQLLVDEIGLQEIFFNFLV